MRIVALKYGESVFGENYIFSGGNKDRLLPISFVFYLMQTKDRNILVDVGCNDGAGFEMSIFEKPLNVLKMYGLSENEITDIIITHAHHDHIEALHEFTNAQIYINSAEFDAAKPYIKNISKVNTFTQNYNLFQNVTVKKIGGHSLGSSVVLCETPNTIFLMCGDECYYKKCLTNKILTGASVNNIKSKEFLDKYSSTAFTPLLFHDPSILAGKIGYEIIY